MLGPLLNSSAVVVGASSGALLGDRIAEPFRERMTQLFGIVSMGLGLAMVPKYHSLPAVMLSLILGTLCGELLHLEEGIARLAGGARALIAKLAPPTALAEEEFLNQYIALIVLYCASGTGIFGAINEGVAGDSSMLIVKTCLDLFSSLFFATVLGFPVILIALPQFALQATLYLCAGRIAPMTAPAMIADFSACGGLIMLATGFRIARIKNFYVANMLPAMLLVMPVSALWARLPIR